uniref:CUB and Sushi multiple domains 2 n=1 Tax=Phasianus colchicus TaxID=9054 RepID=A0A669P8F0_PHACC
MGTVLSPDYPEGYGNNLNCIWTIISDPGSRIHLSFNDFDLESQFDFLAVKDGDSPDSPIIGTSSNFIYLLFTTDNSRSNNGFKIHYESVTVNTYSCLDPGIPVHGRRYGHDFSIGSTVSFSCDPGYRLSHEEPLLCEKNHWWSHPLPTCDGKNK